MTFQPQILKPTQPGPQVWLIVNDGQFLVKPRQNQVLFPNQATLQQLGIAPDRYHFIGILDGNQCYCADPGASLQLPDAFAFLGLRQLFGLISDAQFMAAACALQILEWDSIHRFCGRCGTQTIDKVGERAKICPACSLITYPQIAPAMIVAVSREHEILLARSARYRSGFYSVLAGFVEPGETLEGCVQREVLEEVGIEVTNIHYFGSQPWPFPHSLMVGFTADYLRGTITIDRSELTDAGWFAADALPSIPGPYSIARLLIDDFVARTAKRSE